MPRHCHLYEGLFLRSNFLWAFFVNHLRSRTRGDLQLISPKAKQATSASRYVLEISNPGLIAAFWTPRSWSLKQLRVDLSSSIEVLPFIQ